MHTSISGMLKSLRNSFKTPEATRCPDGYYRRAIYSIGPYIADYPEQCILAAIIQGWCPKYIQFYLLIPSAHTLLDRCMALNSDLEQPAISRTQKLTDELAKLQELGELWSKYGIVGDIVVRRIISILLFITCALTGIHSLSQPTYHEQTSVNYYPPTYYINS